MLLSLSLWFVQRRCYLLTWKSSKFFVRDIKTRQGGDVWLYSTLSSAIDRGGLSASLSRHFNPAKKGRGQLKCDGTRAETRFRLSAKRTSPFKSAGGGRQFSRLLAAEVCASAVVMLDTSCSEVVWRVLATNCIRQFPLHFPSRASPCAITFHMESIHWNG